MEAYHKKAADEKKEQVLTLFLLADLVSERHPMVDRKNHNMSMPWDYYPKLFAEEKEEWQRKKEVDELEAYKEHRRQYVAEFNKRRSGGVEHES